MQSTLRRDDSLDPRYGDPSSYGDDESWDGEGRRPPDWGARRAAVLARDDRQCRRCGRQLGRSEAEAVDGDGDGGGGGSRSGAGEREPGTGTGTGTGPGTETGTAAVIHHVEPVAAGGSHALSNLVALCADCRRLLCPGDTSVAGDWREAPLFPAESADDRVAVVRRPVDEPAKLRGDLRLLAADSAPTANRRSCSDATLDVGATAAIDAGVDIHATLRRRDVTPMGDRKRELAVHVADEFDDPVVGATVAVDADGRGGRTETDADGRVGLLLPTTADEVRVTVTHPDHGAAGATVDLTVGDVVDDRLRSSISLEAPRDLSTGGRALRRLGRAGESAGKVLIAVALLLVAAALAGVGLGVTGGVGVVGALAVPAAVGAAGLLLVACRRVTDGAT
jgi:hypothetical protein